jgi:hypothetical protein
VNNVYFTPESEGGRAIADLDRAEQDFYVRRDKQEYLATAKAFVNSAQKGDIKMMMNVTSPLTFKASGRSTVEKVYATQVIPAFQGTTVIWNTPKDIITDDTGNRGFVISGKASGAKSFPVYVTVMKERGKFRVITLTRKR